MNAPVTISARDQLRAAIAARIETERETTESKEAADRAAQFVAELEAKLSQAEKSTASSIRKLAQHFREQKVETPALPATGRTDLIEQIDVAKRVLAELQASHTAAVGRRRSAANAAAVCARAVMNEVAETIVAELEDLKMRERAIETVLHGLAESGCRLPSEEPGTPFPLTRRAIDALTPYNPYAPERHMINPLKPRIEAGERWRRYFERLLQDADAQFENN